MNRIPVLILIPLVTLSLIGCDESTSSGADLDSDGEASTAKMAVEETDQIAAEAALLVDMIPAEEDLESESALCEAVADIQDGFEEPECVEVSCSGNTASVTFNSCSGDYDQIQVDGTLTGSYAADWDGVVVTYSSDSLWINQVKVDLSGSGYHAWDSEGVAEISTTTTGNDWIDVSFDGSDQASWTTSGSRSGNFPLICGELD